MAKHRNHTQEAIVEVLQKAGGSQRIAALARTLDLSEETIRRNLKRLSEAGVVDKVHGGARLVTTADEGALDHRLALNPEAKQRIARHVADMIDDGESVFLDVGSTTAYIADALRDHRYLMVVTNSVSVAYKLATRNGNRVFFAGGELRAHDGGAFGFDAIAFAGSFKTDIAVLSATAINAQDGLMLFDLNEADFARAAMRNAGRRIVAADSSKMGRSAPIVVCPPQMLDLIVTDAAPPEDFARAAEGWGIGIEIAG